MIYAIRCIRDENHDHATDRCLVETRRPKGTPTSAKFWQEGRHHYRYADPAAAREWVRDGRLHETALYVNDRRVVRAAG